MSPDVRKIVFKLYCLPEYIKRSLEDDKGRRNAVSVTLLDSLRELGGGKVEKQLIAKPSSSGSNVWEVSTELPMPSYLNGRDWWLMTRKSPLGAPRMTEETSQIKIIYGRGNWWEAQSRCKDSGAKLYTPGSDDIPEELVENLQPKTYYWIGAMSHYVWQWKVDGSPLYTYAGFLPLGRVAVEPKGTYLDNSVWKCHLHCSPANSVGMKGTTCYCLEEGYNTINTGTPEVTCPGNLVERCGNSQGMSVYKLENLTFIQEEDTYCAYVEDTDLSIQTSSYDACTQRTDCYACFALFGKTSRISCRPLTSWSDAGKACDLVKLNASARTSLLGSKSTTSTYWIGLYKDFHRRWINGETALKYDGYRGYSDTWCLSVYRTWDGGKRFYWRPCSENREFLCEDVKTSTMTPTSYPQTSTSTTPPQPSKRTGVFIGLGAGCLALVVTVSMAAAKAKETPESANTLHYSHRKYLLQFIFTNDKRNI